MINDGENITRRVSVRERERSLYIDSDGVEGFLDGQSARQASILLQRRLEFLAGARINDGGSISLHTRPEVE